MHFINVPLSSMKHENTNKQAKKHTKTTPTTKHKRPKLQMRIVRKNKNKPSNTMQVDLTTRNLGYFHIPVLPPPLCSASPLLHSASYMGPCFSPSHFIFRVSYYHPLCVIEVSGVELLPSNRWLPGNVVNSLNLHLDVISSH